MVEAGAGEHRRTYLSTPTTKRGYGCPLIMTEGNTHIGYVTREQIVFRGRNGAPDFVYQDHVKRITALG